MHQSGSHACSLLGSEHHTYAEHAEHAEHQSPQQQPSPRYQRSKRRQQHVSRTRPKSAGATYPGQYPGPWARDNSMRERQVNAYRDNARERNWHAQATKLHDLQRYHVVAKVEATRQQAEEFRQSFGYEPAFASSATAATNARKPRPSSAAPLRSTPLMDGPRVGPRPRPASAAVGGQRGWGQEARGYRHLLQ